MVERLEVVLLVLIAPHLVELFLHLPPLGILGLQPSQHQRHGHHRIPFQSVDNVRRLVAVHPPDGPLMDRRARAAQTVVEAVASGLLRRHPRHLLLHALQHLDRVAIRLEHDVEFEALVLGAIDVLLVLGLARGDKLAILRPGGEGDPGVVEDLAAERVAGAAAAALGLHKVLGEGAVGGAQPLAGGIV